MHGAIVQYKNNLHYIHVIYQPPTLPPRLVYRWFLLIYQGTYTLGIVGYLILLLIFTGLGLLLPFKPDTVMEFGVTMVFYGVYYGVLGRDCAELCVDFMAASMTVSVCRCIEGVAYLPYSG